jgi:hypothetical protein
MGASLPSLSSVSHISGVVTSISNTHGRSSVMAATASFAPH